MEFNRLDILKIFKTAFSDIVPKVYYTDRPSSTNTQYSTFIVVKSGDMEDNGAWQDSYINLLVFAKDTDGLESTSVLDGLQKEIFNKLPITNNILFTQKPMMLESKSDGSGFHYLTIYFGIIIK